jgi:hypothetical protein
LIVTPGGGVVSDQYQKEMDRSENNGAPVEELKIVFEKLLTSAPNLWRNEP